MKIRSLKPEFFTDVRMAELSPLARLLYMGLWCIADDAGRGRYLPKQIEGEVFPHDQVDIYALLAELLDTKRIVTYSAGQETLFHIPTFDVHQHPNRTVASRLPAPPKQGGRSANAVSKQRGRTVKAPPVLGEVLVLVEGEVLGEVSVVNRAMPEKGYVWQGFADRFGEPTNGSAEKHRWQNVNPVTESLAKQWGCTKAQVGRRPESQSEVLTRSNRWPLHFDTATLTERALMTHWDELGREPLRATKQQVNRMNGEVAAAKRTEELRSME